MVEFEDPACNVVEDVMVVSDDDDCAFVVVSRSRVKVVGGFVEQ